ncbi:MAG: dTMP kinase [Saccharofermentans sp.]|nr:dTMP kinase [Saccharofermentans sp.]
MTKGLFITFEGIDGCGKSTQLRLLKEFFDSNNIEYVEVREPGGTKIGEKIRGVLLDKKNDSMVPMAELLLFEAARAQIVEEVIKPSLACGKCVICDRFFDSSSAYQGYANGMGAQLVSSMNDIATGGLKPDVTFLLDIDPKTAYERRNNRGEEEDRIELMGLNYQDKVRAGYLEIEANEDRVVKIDAVNSPEAIFAIIKEKVWDLIV